MMEPGRGYLIQVTNNATLTYTEPPPKPSTRIVASAGEEAVQFMEAEVSSITAATPEDRAAAQTVQRRKGQAQALQGSEKPTGRTPPGRSSAGSTRHTLLRGIPDGKLIRRPTSSR